MTNEPETDEPRIACPPEDEMWLLIEGGTPAADAGRIRRHLDGCSACQAVVGALLGASGPPSPAPAADAPGTVYAQRYEILEPLGAGAMGTVVRARDRQLERDVALKLLRTGHHAERSASARVLRESKAMASLRHPNVVTVFDAFEEHGSVVVVMEVLNGGSLRERAHDRRPWHEVCRTLLEAGEGLLAVHEAGWVHRDFKPDNILLDDAGHAHVADFGLARALSVPASDVTEPTIGGADDPLRTETGRHLGTPLYMAPEQFSGADVDASADVYAFCLTAVELLLGRRPFDAVTLRALRKAKRAGAAPPIPRGSAPRTVRDVLRRGVAPDPSSRPSLSAVLAALRSALARRARRPAVVAIGTSALFMAGLGVAATRSDGPCDRIPPSAWTASHAASMDAAQPSNALAGEVLTAFAEAHQAAWSQACSIPEGPSRDARLNCLRAQHTWVQLDVELLTQAALPPQAIIDSTPAPMACKEGASMVLRPVPDADAGARWRRLRLDAATARRARMLGETPQAYTTASALRTQLDPVADAWFVADTELTLGNATYVRDDYGSAQQHLLAATQAASMSGHWHALARANLQLSTVALNVDEDLDEAEHRLVLAQAALERMEGTHAARALACMVGQGEAALSEAKGDLDGAEQQRLQLVSQARRDAPAHVANALMELGRLRVSMGKHAEGVALLEEALEELGPPTAENNNARGVVYRHLCEAATISGDLDAALVYIGQRRALIEDADGWTRRVVPVWIDELQVRLLRGEAVRAKASFTALQEHFEHYPDAAERYRRKALRFAVEIAGQLEDFEACEDHARALLSDPAFDVHSLDGVNTRLIRTSCLQRLGQLDRALETADAASRSAQLHAETPTLLALALTARADVHLARADARLAVLDAEAALAAIPSADPWSMRAYVEGYLCRARYAAGDVKRAAEMAPRIAEALEGPDREAFAVWATEAGLELE